jgi:hypothetical protein
MSESTTRRQKSSGTDPTNFPQLREREHFSSIPQSWLNAGRDADAGDGDLELVATECVYTRTLHNHGSSTTPDFAEHEELVVRYQDPATGVSRTRTYLASKRGGEIVPKCFRTRSPRLFAASIAVPRTEADA